MPAIFALCAIWKAQIEPAGARSSGPKPGAQLGIGRRDKPDGRAAVVGIIDTALDIDPSALPFEKALSTEPAPFPFSGGSEAIFVRKMRWDVYSTCV